tara:strand:- start:233 stop:739 length:507 start_codon:yes stop_codon:yes gene_type:complete
MLDKDNLLKNIDEKGYNFTVHNHKPLFTVEDSMLNRGKIKGAHSKNLFLKNKKNCYFLFSCLEDTKVELKKVAKSLKLGNISFAKEEDLKKYLGVRPGSVTPFGLLNDKENEVQFYLDNKVLSQKIINFHPLINTATISLSVVDFMNFFLENNKKVNIFNFDNYSLIS